MGALAMWGGLAGAGKGIELNAQEQSKDEDFKRQEAKDARMQLLAHQYRTSEQGALFQQETGLESQRAASAQSVAEYQQGETTKRERETRTSTEKIAAAGETGKTEREKARDRTLLGVASIKSATEKAKTAAGKPRFVQQKFILPGGIDPATGQLTPAKGYTQIYDRGSGFTFQQGQSQVKNPKTGQMEPGGTKFFLVDKNGNIDPSAARRAPMSEVQALLANPEEGITKFANTYKFVPPEWVAKMTQTGGMGSGEPTPAGPASEFGSSQEDNSADNTPVE